MNNMPITRKGVKLVIAGLLVMIAGYILLSGGRSADPAVFDYSMFNFRRLVAAPIVMVAGIVTIIVAIVRKPKDEEE